MKNISLLILLSFHSLVIEAAEVSVHRNEDSGLLTWTLADNGFKIELIQLLPDFIRAIYAKHRFPQAEVERAASYCVFGTILQNTSERKLRYDVRDWRYRVADGEEFPVKTKTQWLKEWQAAGITFSWTLLPDRGDFEVGDWQQGFTTIQLPRETRFDMIFRWQLDDESYSAVLNDIQCAPESISENN